MLVHPVPVHIPTLAIVVTRGKGGDTSFSIGVIGTRPLMAFLPFPCAIWSSLFRNRCLPIAGMIALQYFGRCLFVLIRKGIILIRGSIVVIFGLLGESEPAADGAGSEREHLNTLLDIDAWCKADCQTQSPQVVHVLVTAG